MFSVWFAVIQAAVNVGPFKHATTASRAPRQERSESRIRVGHSSKGVQSEGGAVDGGSSIMKQPII